MKIVETRRLFHEDLRNLCILHNWYTMGDNQEYSHMFELTDKENLTTADLVEIAADIIDHSEPDESLTIVYVCFELARTAISLFFDKDSE